MKIAVMAGTPIDTEMGEDILKENEFLDLISFPISENPIEQTIFQTSTNDFKEKVINEFAEMLYNYLFKCTGIIWDRKCIF